MLKATGEEFKRLSNKKFCKVNRIDTKFLLQIIVKAKKVLETLHSQNIFIGDLNDQNLLFDKSGNIFFLDCDSWAVGGEKCSVAMDLFKDPKLHADDFNADTDNYAFMVLAWKILTRIHPFGGTMNPDMQIMDRISKGISVIGRSDVKIPRTVKKWNGLAPDLISDFKDVFESGKREISSGFDVMLKDLMQCNKCHEYYYGKFSSCPYCDKSAEIDKKPELQGSFGNLVVYPMYHAKDIMVMLDRYTYIDRSGYVNNGNFHLKADQGIKYHFLDKAKVITEHSNRFVIHSDKNYDILKKPNTPVEVSGDKVFFISENNTLTEVTVLNAGNAIKSICKVGNNAYFSADNGHYCAISHYRQANKIHVIIDGKNIEIPYDSEIQNYGIHRDKVSGGWLIILEDSKGIFDTYIIKDCVEYHTDKIKYECSLYNPCIVNSTIFIPIDGKIRGFSYKKSAYKDFECAIVSEDSKLIKDKKKFVVVNTENVYMLSA